MGWRIRSLYLAADGAADLRPHARVGHEHAHHVVVPVNMCISQKRVSRVDNIMVTTRPPMHTHAPVVHGVEEKRVRVPPLPERRVRPGLEQQRHMVGVGVAGVQRRAAVLVDGVDVHVLLLCVWCGVISQYNAPTSLSPVLALPAAGATPARACPWSHRRRGQAGSPRGRCCYDGGSGVRHTQRTHTCNHPVDYG